jgi:hypothetical protein
MAAPSGLAAHDESALLAVVGPQGDGLDVAQAGRLDADEHAGGGPLVPAGREQQPGRGQPDGDGLAPPDPAGGPAL